jgi:hypothetical protein
VDVTAEASMHHHDTPTFAGRFLVQDRQRFVALSPHE